MDKIIIAYIMDGKAGGVDKYIMSVIPDISEKYEITLLTSGRNEELEERLKDWNVKLIEVPRLSHPFKQYKEIKKIIKKNKFNISYLNTSTAFNIPFMLACRKEVNIRIVHSHSSGNDCSSKIKKIVLDVAQKIGKNIMATLANRYYACSHHAGVWMFPKRIVEKSSDFRIIPNMRDFDKFYYDAEVRNVLKQSYKCKGKKVIGHISNFQPVKNVAFIVDIMRKICEKSDDYRLLLIGEGPEKRNVIEKIQQYGLEKKVFALPYQKDIEKYYQMMDYFLLPSYFEGFPLVGIEAQVAGVYCIFSDTITKEIQISNGCSFKSICQGAQIWCDEILKIDWKREEWKLNENAENYNKRNQKKLIGEVLR